MPRSIWNGTIAFGVVAVPIKLYSAVAPKTVHFHEVHLEDGARIEHRTFCSKEDKEVPRDDVVKGFEVRSGRYVVVDKEEIDAAGGTRARIIDVDRFVALDAIDPVFFDKSYFVGPQDDGVDAYKLLQAALKQSERAAIGRFTFHNREYLIALRAYDTVMALHTMRFADELVAPKDLDVPRAARKPDKREIAMAGKLIESLHAAFRPGRIHDEHRETILAAIRKKAKSGKDIEPPDEDVDTDASDDLSAALEASLA
ncbi:Non-homologous end joining protein Ku [Baekduia alba]|uniref:non-homologous end joining protein Ku n=1 Tax=Baekduia alba TaxID=2997333 RepID=UPI00233FAFF7|nr:Ku protein [Baekduia alba]WCB96466.1 Non-homologous end joining protein Ku [Baekduia alba]